jgi:hypothetical protein
MLLELLLLVHDFALVMLILVLLILFPLEILVIFLMIASFLSLSEYFGMFLRETQDFIFKPNFASC